jgi:hypothetical protein
VRYSRAGVVRGVAGAGAHELILVVVASGASFPEDATKVAWSALLCVRVSVLVLVLAVCCCSGAPALALTLHAPRQATTGPVDVLGAGPGTKFDASLASSLLAESLGSPTSSKTRVLHMDVSHGRIDPVDVLDGDASARESAARVGYPFAYNVLWLAQGGKEMDLFAPEGVPLPIARDGKLNLLVTCPEDDDFGTEMAVGWEREMVGDQLRVAIVKEGDIDHLDVVIRVPAALACLVPCLVDAAYGM